MRSVPSAPNSITIKGCHTRSPYPSDSVPMGLGSSGMSDSELDLSTSSTRDILIVIHHHGVDSF